MNSMLKAAKKVMDKERIRKSIKRLALEVAEQNFDQQQIILAGIAGNGEVVSKSVEEELRNLDLFKIVPVTIALNKKDPSTARLSSDTDLSDQTVIIIDDVANTGKTMLYAMLPVLAQRPRKIQTLVLVERSHKLFPVQTDFAGLSISTTMMEHIYVEVEEGRLSSANLV
jgi:pyrimidine operon attenuation protein / uracil phosphoribosyltransferase